MKTANYIAAAMLSLAFAASMAFIGDWMMYPALRQYGMVAFAVLFVVLFAGDAYDQHGAKSVMMFRLKGC